MCRDTTATETVHSFGRALAMSALRMEVPGRGSEGAVAALAYSTRTVQSQHKWSTLYSTQLRLWEGTVRQILVRSTPAYRVLDENDSQMAGFHGFLCGPPMSVTRPTSAPLWRSHTQLPCMRSITQVKF